MTIIRTENTYPMFGDGCVRRRASEAVAWPLRLLI
jgi:hypothetical protein